MIDPLVVRIISAVVANVSTKSGEALDLNVTVAREMVEQLLMEARIKDINRGLRK